ncbi:MAG: RdgB/HAM1 family non-canonical purine NTP pyrophosphatase [Salinibacterium sp.]|nr:MAG: RdgB/HAM1 family non-canonical purine NTP pyrophosphatase [Salinibacterium sp.]
MTVALVLATRNAHKVEELRRILGPDLDGIDLVSYEGPEPVENGATFEENALIKARAAAANGRAAIADDSGIVVDALGGAPGIHSARYAGTRDDADNVALVLANLGAESNRAAHFVCAAALVLPDGTEFVRRGEWHGSILEHPSGHGGFGYDPIFQPDGLDLSAAELTADEKNAISHRALAFRALMPIVRSELLR